VGCVRGGGLSCEKENLLSGFGDRLFLALEDPTLEKLTVDASRRSLLRKTAGLWKPIQNWLIREITYDLVMTQCIFMSNLLA